MFPASVTLVRKPPAESCNTGLFYFYPSLQTSTWFIRAFVCSFCTVTAHNLDVHSSFRRPNFPLRLPGSPNPRKKSVRAPGSTYTPLSFQWCGHFSSASPPASPTQQVLTGSLQSMALIASETLNPSFLYDKQIFNSFVCH